VDDDDDDDDYEDAVFFAVDFPNDDEHALFVFVFVVNFDVNFDPAAAGCCFVANNAFFRRVRLGLAFGLLVRLA